MLEDRGQTDLRNFVCELLNRICHSTLNHTHYEIHHKDFCHDNYDPTNLIGLDNGILHKLAHMLPEVHGGSSLYKWSDRYNAVVYDAVA